MDHIDQIIAKLTQAQRGYLVELEMNAPGGLRQELWQFTNRKFRSSIRGAKLATARALIRKGIVRIRPEPCECGYHFASLTPLGLSVKARLEEQDD